MSSGFRIANVKLVLHEDGYNSGAQLVVEWAHGMASASHVLKLCGGIDLPPIAMLESYGLDQRSLRTVRTFRFESREDALAAYDKFETLLRAQTITEKAHS